MSTDQEKLAVAANIKGAFKRSATEFHDTVSADKDSQYPAESGRYHLYYSIACPWCHRVLVLMAVKGLNEVISSSNVSPFLRNMKTEHYIGWEFDETYPDPLHKDSKSVWDIYKIHDPQYTNKKLTVPIFFDKKSQKIVNNESAEIISFLNSEFNEFAKNSQIDLNPNNEQIQASMQEWNDLIYPSLNDGVYRCGFARSQQAYNEALDAMFKCLDNMEAHLSKSLLLCGDVLTLYRISERGLH